MSARSPFVTVQAFTICLAVLVGGADVYSDGLNKRAKNQIGHADILAEPRALGISTDSWNRFGRYRVAHSQAARSTPSSLTLRAFIEDTSDLSTHMDSVHRAIESLLLVTTITPEEDGAWSDLAWLYAVDGNTARAIECERKAIALYGDDYTYYVLLGSFHERLGQLDAAGSAYEKAITLYPRLATSSFWSALRSRKGALADSVTESASRHLADASRDSDEVVRNERRARLMLIEGKRVEAMAIISAVNKELPNLSGAWELQGELQEQANDVGEASREYNRARFLDPTDPLPYAHLAMFEISADRLQEARADALQAWNLARRLRSPGDLRRSIQYRRRDDFRRLQVPTDLLEETQPAIAFETMFGRLASLFSALGDTLDAKEMASLALQAKRLAELLSATGDTTSETLSDGPEAIY